MKQTRPYSTRKTYINVLFFFLLMGVFVLFIYTAVNGDFRDWDTIDFLLNEEVRFKVDSDTDYLYLYLESQNMITSNNFYLGIDVNKKKWQSGLGRRKPSFLLTR